jgi:Mrp family chromosome partitioning ATPase
MDVTDSVAAGRQRVVGFADVVRIPLRRWQTVGAVTAVVTLVTMAYLLLVPATYTATTVVVLRPVVTDPFTFPSSGADRVINMTAESGIALGNDVIDATAKALNRPSDDVRNALAIEVPTGGQVLRFEFSGDSESQSVAGANAAAQTYLTVREKVYQQQREAQLLSYDSTIKQVTDQRKEAQKGLPDGGSGGDSMPASTQAVLDQVNALNDQIAQLANQRAKIASADLTPGNITAAARAPVPSSHDRGPLFALAAMLGGLLAGLLLAHGQEAMDRRVRSLDQAAELVGGPNLGVVRGGRHATEESVAADARYVSLALVKWIDRHPDQPLVVLSGNDREGRSAVAGNLAVAIAETGETVHLAATADSQNELNRILFTAQQRTPPRPRSRPLPARNGATIAAPGAVRLPATALTATGAGAGDSDTTQLMATLTPRRRRAEQPVLTDPVGMLIGDGEVRLVELGTEPDHGVVVIDAPPSETDERGVRAAQAGVAVLVVARDHTRNGDLSRLVSRLRAAGAQTIGFVLTGGSTHG